MTISIRKRSSPCIEELEPRILYSADLSPIAPDAPAPAPVQRVINADGEFSFSGSAAATASTLRCERKRWSSSMPGRLIRKS